MRIINAGLLAVLFTFEAAQSEYVVIPDANVPEANIVCTPMVRTYLGYNRRLIQFEGGNKIAFFSLGSSKSNWLFVLDTRDLSVNRYDMPNGDVGSHGSALGTDGNIYIMPYATGRAYCFDTKTREFKNLQVELPPGEYTWDCIGGDNGKVYFGTYPNGCFGEYDPVSGKTTLLKNARNTKYVSTFFKDANDSVGCYAIGPGTLKMRYKFKSGKLEDVNDAPQASSVKSDKSSEQTPRPEIKAPEGDLLYFGKKYAAELSQGGKNFAISFPSSRLWEVKSDGRAKLLGKINAPGEPWYMAAAGNGIVGISYFGVVFRYDFGTSTIIQKQLDNLYPGGSELMFIEPVGGGDVIGAHGSQQDLFKLNIVTGKIDYAPTMVARTVGEPMCAINYQTRAYLGIYTKAILSVYDPAMPFEFGKNPREIGCLEEHKQTRPRDAATDGRHVFMTVDSDYNCLGGALAVIDASTNKVEAYPQIIKEQNLPSIVYDEASGLAWGGTDRWGQMKSVPPTQESSMVYAFDAVSRSAAAKIVVWPGSDETTVLGVSGKGELVIGNPATNEMAMLNTKTREVTWKGTNPLGKSLPSKFKKGADGFYCIAGDGLYKWDFDSRSIRQVGKLRGCRHFCPIEAGVWAMADSISVYKLDLRGNRK